MKFASKITDGEKNLYAIKEIPLKCGALGQLLILQIFQILLNGDITAPLSV